MSVKDNLPLQPITRKIKEEQELFIGIKCFPRDVYGNVLPSNQQSVQHGSSKMNPGVLWSNYFLFQENVDSALWMQSLFLLPCPLHKVLPPEGLS